MGYHVAIFSIDFIWWEEAIWPRATSFCELHGLFLGAANCGYLLQTLPFPCSSSDLGNMRDELNSN